MEAYHHTRADPEGRGIAAAMRKALDMAGVGPETVDHIHLHGTATPANDLSEYNGCRSVFGSRLPEIPVCSTKSMTGHTYGAAGALSAGFAVLSLQTGIVPPTLFHEHLDERFAGLSVSSSPISCELNRVLTVSLGFGGEAFALVLSREASQWR
jgi:3-oxoacyl-[acyl-carrier-protein] synthase II